MDSAAPTEWEGEKSIRKIIDDDGKTRCLVKRAGRNTFFSRQPQLSIIKSLWKDIGILMNWKLK